MRWLGLQDSDLGNPVFAAPNVETDVLLYLRRQKIGRVFCLRHDYCCHLYVRVCVLHGEQRGEQQSVQLMTGEARHIFCGCVWHALGNVWDGGGQVDLVVRSCSNSSGCRGVRVLRHLDCKKILACSLVTSWAGIQYEVK